ncbi:MAG TPA: DUF5667 domain-containing protein [Jatrophihabitans sp.]|jgi:hypothetical protein
MSEHRSEADLVARLSSLPAGPRPDATFKRELRTQLVAITSRIVAESTDAAPPAAEATGPVNARRPARPAPAGRAVGRTLGRLRRPILVFGSAAAVLVVLLGLAVWMAQRAIPGDSLYGVKRASENVKLSIAGNNEDKGNTYLQLAGTRAGEAVKMLPSSSADVPSGHTISLWKQTLDSADSDARNGMKLLSTASVAQVSADPLAKVSGWLPAQRSKLSDVLARTPAGDLRTRAQASMRLLDQIQTRVSDLKGELGCSCLSPTSPSDDLGPKPCSPCRTLVPGVPPGNNPLAPSGTIPGLTPSGPTSGTGSTPSSSKTPGSRGGAGASLVPGRAQLPGASLPGAPTRSVATPSPAGGALSTGSSGAGVSIPGTGISAGVGTGGVTASLPNVHPTTVAGVLAVN